MIEYQPSKESAEWKVETFEWLSAEFSVSELEMPAFHRSISKLGRPWQIIRLLYGINPVIVPSDTDADYLRAWTRVEVAIKLDLDERGLNDQLGIARSIWEADRPKPAEDEGPRFVASKKKKSKPSPDKAVPASKPQTAAVASAPRRTTVTKKTIDDEVIVKLDLPALADEGDLELLLQYGFSDSTFNAIDRTIPEAVAERSWFVARLKDLQRLFDEPAVASLATGALLNEMAIRRMNAEIVKTRPGSNQFRQHSDVKSTIEREYREQWDQIQEIIPWASQVGNKMTFTTAVSEMIDAYKKFKAFDDNTLIDGFLTAYEIQIMCREAVQHDIRYRPGQVASIREAVAGLWDPNFKRKISDKTCKAMDEGFREAYKRAREQLGEPLTDLESDDPINGEYPPLFHAAPKEEPAEVAEEPAQEIPTA